jgi:hypothetical protein
MACIDTPSNTDGTAGLGGSGGTRTRVGVQVATGHCSVGTSPTQISFWLKAPASPSGNGSMKIYNNAGTLVATSTNTVAWSTLTTSFVETIFTFDGTYTIVANDRIVIEGGTVSDANQVQVSAGDPDESMDQNLTQYQSSVWSTNSARNTRCSFGSATPASDTLLPPPVAWI